jgi:DNA-binding XRE family transcriptional regulator
MPQQPRHLDPWVSSIAYFGAELRALRTRHGLSQAQLGRAVHISGDLIAKIEKGQRRPAADLIHRLDHKLAAHGSLTRLIVTMHGIEDDIAPDGAAGSLDGSVGSAGSGSAGSGSAGSGSAGSGSAGSGSAASGLPAEPTAGQVPGRPPTKPRRAGARTRPIAEPPVPATDSVPPLDLALIRDRLSHEGGTESLAALRQVIDGMRQLDHGLGSGLGLSALPAHAEIADALVQSTTGALHTQALSTLGEIHQLTGWMRFDQGDARGAELSFEAARAIAEQAGDDALMAYILGPSQGFAETYYGDPAGGARHCAEALVWARRAGNTRLTAFVLTIGARAQARLGDRQRCREMLELARRELAQHHPSTPDPVWLEVFDRAALRGHTGSCLLDLGQPRRAIAPLAQQDETAPRTFLRNRVIWLLDRARAHLELNEVDEGCAAISQALDAAAGTSSRRTLSRFQAIDGRLRAAGLAAQPQVTELHERLRLLAVA